MERALLDELARLILKLEEGIDFAAKIRVARASLIEKGAAIVERKFQRRFYELGHSVVLFRPLRSHTKVTTGHKGVLFANLLFHICAIRVIRG